MTVKVTRKPAASASEDLRPRVGTGTPLAPAPLRALPGWNARIRAWAEAA